LSLALDRLAALDFAGFASQARAGEIWRLLMDRADPVVLAGGGAVKPFVMRFVRLIFGLAAWIG
jgi:hypothetical protein